MQVKLEDATVRKKVHNRTSRGRNDPRNERMREQRLLREHQQRSAAMTIGGGASMRGGRYTTRGQGRGGKRAVQFEPTRHSIIAGSSSLAPAVPRHIPQHATPSPLVKYVCAHIPLYQLIASMPVVGVRHGHSLACLLSQLSICS